MQMAELQRPSQGEDEGYIFLLLGRLADDGDGGGRARGKTAGQWCVVVDVEFEEMEEWVGDWGDGAVDVGLDAVLQLERETGLVACREGNVF
jgi:hypothetical protein